MLLTSIWGKFTGKIRKRLLLGSLLTGVLSYIALGAHYCNAPLFSRAALRRSSQKMVVSEILRTFVSERLQMTNVSWRSRSNRPTRELRRSRSVAKAEPPVFLPYTTFVKFASVHVLPSAPFCRGNMSEPGSDQHHSRVPIRKAADNPGSAANLFHDAFETVICP